MSTTITLAIAWTILIVATIFAPISPWLQGFVWGVSPAIYGICLFLFLDSSTGRKWVRKVRGR